MICSFLVYIPKRGERPQAPMLYRSVGTETAVAVPGNIPAGQHSQRAAGQPGAAGAAGGADARGAGDALPPQRVVAPRHSR